MIIVALFKIKGNKADCGIYYYISLPPIAGKILAQVILNHLINCVSEESPVVSQCAFRPGCSTIDVVFSLRQVQEKCIEQHMDLYAVFINLTKAFSIVNREALCVILTKLGCPSKFIHIIWPLHAGMIDLILFNGDTSRPFEVSSGMMQGCVLVTVLFNLFFTCILNHALLNSTSRLYL